MNMSDVSNLMKRCQRGVGGRNALDEAHRIMAECYGTLGRLQEEIERQRNVIKILERDVATAHAEELRAMSYLSEVRAIVGGDDFPHMVERVRIETQRWKNQHERDSKELRRLCAERDQYRMRLRNLLAHGSNIHALPFADKILGKLRRFNEQAGDPDADGVDIGRHWLDMLTQLGLLNRVQKSPATWEITAQGEDALLAHDDPTSC